MPDFPFCSAGIFSLCPAYAFPMDWRLIVPDETDWDKTALDEAREVRLRPGQPVVAFGPGGIWRGSHSLSPAEVTQAAQALSGHSLAAHREELEKGFLPLPGGHRLGVCGVRGARGTLEITSLCLRVAHEIKGAGDSVFPLIRGCSTLIIGPPGSGKTTLLRDLIRLYSLNGVQVGVADERGEIAACQNGAPQMDVGPMTDVITGTERSQALSLLVRAMSPQVAATDEIGGERDASALGEALRCGVTVLATAHGRNIEDILRRQSLAALFRQGVFDKWVRLEAAGVPSQVFSWTARGE